MHWPHLMWVGVPLVFSAAQLALAQALDAATIVRRSVEASAASYRALPAYNYFKTERGKDGVTRSYEEIMLLGSRYSRLVAVRGEPLSSQRDAEEQQKLQSATRSRMQESPSERAKRVAGYERERRRDAEVLSEIAQAFTFTPAGQEMVDGHSVYVLRASPRRGYQPRSTRTRVLTGMQGELWVDQETFQWVRVEATVIHPVSIEGFLARVEEGTRFAIEQMPVEPGIWLPRHFSMLARARVLFLFTSRQEQDETYYGYYRNGS